eukprot:361871-Chlamydomonas_euryale.AAC.2
MQRTCRRARPEKAGGRGGRDASARSPHVQPDGRLPLRQRSACTSTPKDQTTRNTRRVRAAGARKVSIAWVRWCRGDLWRVPSVSSAAASHSQRVWRARVGAMFIARCSVGHRPVLRELLHASRHYQDGQGVTRTTTSQPLGNRGASLQGITIKLLHVPPYRLWV